ncbi:MAG: lipoprotein [Bacillota bacterium]
MKKIITLFILITIVLTGCNSITPERTFKKTPEKTKLMTGFKGTFWGMSKEELKKVVTETPKEETDTMFKYVSNNTNDNLTLFANKAGITPYIDYTFTADKLTTIHITAGGPNFDKALYQDIKKMYTLDLNEKPTKDENYTIDTYKTPLYVTSDWEKHKMKIMWLDSHTSYADSTITIFYIEGSKVS